jgi:hypothetical protein
MAWSLQCCESGVEHALTPHGGVRECNVYAVYTLCKIDGPSLGFAPRGTLRCFVGFRFRSQIEILDVNNQLQ